MKGQITQLIVLGVVTLIVIPTIFFLNRGSGRNVDIKEAFSPTPILEPQAGSSSIPPLVLERIIGQPDTTVLPSPTPALLVHHKQTGVAAKKQDKQDIIAPLRYPPIIQSPAPLFPVAPLIAAREVLPLPAVDVSELNIGSDGIAAAYAYLEYFALHAGEVSFDGAQFAALQKNSSGLPLLPSDLIEQGLAAGTLAGGADSLRIQRGFIAAKIEFEKKIRVTGEAISLNQLMISADILTIELIDRALAVAENKRSISELKDYYSAYQNTISAYRPSVARAALPPEENGNFASRVLRDLGFLPIIERALAVSLGFGGFIVETLPCTCPPAGYVITLTPGYLVPGTPGAVKLYITYATISSPLLFLNKSPVQYRWVLGKHAPTPGTCWEFDPDGCFPIDFWEGVVVYVGTTLY